MIKKYGSVHSIPEAAIPPDKSLEYNLLFDCRRPAEKEDGVNPGLNHAARLINLFESAGINPEQMQLVVIISGPATRISLNKEEYLKRFGLENPDQELVSELKYNGVKVYVCGQSLVENGFGLDNINPDITIASSAMSVLANFQLRGYALMSY